MSRFFGLIPITGNNLWSTGNNLANFSDGNIFAIFVNNPNHRIEHRHTN